jgi:glucose/mannose-6-phosphate isomerase
MTPNLDNKEEIKKADTGNILDSIRLLPDQANQAWNEVKEIKVPTSYKEVENVVLCGMGGSSLGGRIVHSFASSRLRVPLEIITDYKIPNYVGHKTLLVACSYSGGTEETITCLKEGIKMKAKVFSITTNGELTKLSEARNVPHYTFLPKYNPSGQPRLALGYATFSLLSLLNSLGLITYSDDEVKETLSALKSKIEEFDTDKKEAENLAKRMAQKFYQRAMVLVASEHLIGSSHTFKNQLNENAKNFSVLFDLPELNHHLMEGLKFPSKAKDILTFLFIESELYSERVKKRYPLTIDVVEKNGYQALTYKTNTESKMAQAAEIFAFSSFMSFYLSYLNQVDSSKIPWVDYFKEKLSS